MWCGYWPISRDHGDVIPSSCLVKRCYGIHLYEFLCVSICSQLLSYHDSHLASWRRQGIGWLTGGGRWAVLEVSVTRYHLWVRSYTVPFFRWRKVELWPSTWTLQLTKGKLLCVCSVYTVKYMHPHLMSQHPLTPWDPPSPLHSLFPFSFRTSDYPFLCLAYKLPPNHPMGININILGVGWRTIRVSSTGQFGSPVIASFTDYTADRVYDDDRWMDEYDVTSWLWCHHDVIVDYDVTMMSLWLHNLLWCDFSCYTSGREEMFAKDTGIQGRSTKVLTPPLWFLLTQWYDNDSKTRHGCWVWALVLPYFVQCAHLIN